MRTTSQMCSSSTGFAAVRQPSTEHQSTHGVVVLGTMVMWCRRVSTPRWPLPHPLLETSSNQRLRFVPPLCLLWSTFLQLRMEIVLVTFRVPARHVAMLAETFSEPTGLVAIFKSTCGSRLKTTTH